MMFILIMFFAAALIFLLSTGFELCVFIKVQKDEQATSVVFSSCIKFQNN